MINHDLNNATQKEGVIEEQGTVTEHKIPHHSNASEALHLAGLPDDTIKGVLDAARASKILERFPAGSRFVVRWDRENSDVPAGVTFYRSASKTIVFTPDSDGSWTYENETLSEDLRVVSFSGAVTTSLWDSAAASGMSSSLISSLADVFAWKIDFSREVQKGDRWRLSVEQRMIAGKPVGWGNVLSCEYESRAQTYTALRFPQQGENGAYFAPDGSSLQSLFLKAPIQFARITSRFNKTRFHPILKITRPHLGVDYGAVTGTPVMAVGSGRVEFAGFNGDSGRMIRLRHNGSYQTAYMHLSALADNLKVGAYVEQGDIIGKVGSTGLATAPHLHFSLYQSGSYVDPLGLSFPSASPVAPEDQETFNGVAQNALQLLPEWGP